MWITTRKKSNKQKKLAEKNDLNGENFLCQDAVTAKIDDATAILFWFTDIEIIEKMKKRFQSLQDGCKIVTIWGPLPECLPAQVDFPYIINQVPFKHANLKEQLSSNFWNKNALILLLPGNMRRDIQKQLHHIIQKMIDS